MGFFGGKKSSSSISPASLEKPVEDLGVVIHAMPRDFLGKDAKLRVEQAPPVPIPVIPIAPKVIIPPVKQRRVPLALWIVLAVVFLLAVGAVAYVVFTKSTPQPVPVAPVITTPLPVTEPIKTPTVIEKPKVPVQSTDSDSDGITDIEERMYGTDYRNPDSDGDTFLDGNEVFHRYDPNGLSPSTLLDTGAVKIFTDAALPFTVYYPLSWKQSLDTAKNMVTFKTSALASVTIAWGAKDTDLTVEDWVLKHVKDADISTLKSSYTKEGYYTLRSKDDLVAYVDGGTHVYAFTYALNGSLEISYVQTFAMMVNSFHLAP